MRKLTFGRSTLCYTVGMTPEFTLITILIAIFTTGVGLASLIFVGQRNLVQRLEQRLDRQEQRAHEAITELRHRLDELAQKVEALGREVAEIKGFLRYDTSPRTQANA